MLASSRDSASGSLRLGLLTGLIALTLGVACSRWSNARALARDCADGPSCVALARSLLGDNYPTRPAEVRARAAVIYQKGCDLGSAQACEFLGTLLEDSELVPRDLPRAARLFERGCTLKDAIACYSLSHLYHDARGVPFDPAREAHYRKLGCDLGRTLTDPAWREQLCR
jgi:TPR repeat protein